MKEKAMKKTRSYKPLPILLGITRRVMGVLALLVATAGFLVLGMNPMPWIAPYLPISYAGFYVDAAYVESLLVTTQTDYVVLGSVIAVSLLLVLSAVILLVQSPKRAVKGFIRSPLSTFRGVVRGRNWLLAKVEYLQSESAKWKTTFNIMKSPYSLLRSMGFSPQMAVGLLFAGSTVGTGVVVNETILAERSFRAGDAGVYAAPNDIPVSYVTDPEEDGYNTLRVDLGATPVRAITVENTSLNIHTGSALPSGQQNVLEVGGNPASSGFTATRLLVGVLTFENNRCKSLELSDIQTHLLVIAGNSSDGMSIAPTAASGAANRRMAIGGGNHSAAEMTHSGGLFDRLWISSNVSGVSGSVDKLTLKNISSRAGPCKLSRINASEIHILLNTIGHDSNLATKEFVVATNVTAAVIVVEDNVEMNVTEPATQ